MGEAKRKAEAAPPAETAEPSVQTMDLHVPSGATVGADRRGNLVIVLDEGKPSQHAIALNLPSARMLAARIMEAARLIETQAQRAAAAKPAIIMPGDRRFQPPQR